MRTYPIIDTVGILFALEVENLYIGLRGLQRVLRELPGYAPPDAATCARKTSDVRLRFMYRQQPFMVWEPYGDSSRYWLGPEQDDAEHIDISEIARARGRYDPPLYRQIAGDILSFRIFGFNADSKCG